MIRKDGDNEYLKKQQRNSLEGHFGRTKIIPWYLEVSVWKMHYGKFLQWFEPRSSNRHESYTRSLRNNGEFQKCKSPILTVNCFLVHRIAKKHACILAPA